MTSDLRGHMVIRYLTNDVSKYRLTLKMAFIDLEVIHGCHLYCCRSSLVTVTLSDCLILPLVGSLPR